jgi:phosphatidylglycerophosphate synthase
MKQTTPDFEGLDSHLEAMFLVPLRRLRQKLFGSFTTLLACLGIRADMLSFASALPGIGFFLLARSHLTMAFCLLFVSFALDNLDGVLARQTQTCSIAGAFTDMFCDLIVLALLVAGVVWNNLVNPVLAISFIFMYTVFGMFYLLHRLLDVSTAWIIRPGKTFLLIALALYIIFHIDLLNYLLGIYLLTLPFLGISFWRLKKAL